VSIEDKDQTGQSSGTNQTDRAIQTNPLSTGQAAYGNSGQADAAAPMQQQSRNSASFGSDNDVGDSHAAAQVAEDASNPQGMPLGTAGGGYGGSASTDEQQSANQANQATGVTNPQSDFARDGQGALDSNSGGASSGATDVETERAQGRTSDIEGSSL
jgi:hypothetical protein